MAEKFRETFVNPYVDEDAYEAQFSTFVSMDEAHERWNNGTWHAAKTEFELDPSMFAEDRGLKLDSEGRSAEKPKANRFAFDLQKDIIDADQLTSDLDENAYTGNYRPHGTIGSTLSNLTLDRLKYNALADIREELPEDLSYLYGEGEGARFKKKREVKLRSHRRLSTSVDKRRAEVEKMIPDENKESPEAIMADIRRRKDIEDAKSGIDSRSRRKFARRGIYDVRSADGSAEDFYTVDDEYDIEGVTERGSWRADIPVQDGLVPDSREMPYFGRFSRRWSDMESLDPTRTEMLRHTVDTIYEDSSPEKAGGRFRTNTVREYYVPDSEFDPRDRYRRMQNQRRSVRAGDNVLSESIMSGEFNNPYVQISNDRLRHIINHDMRGPGHVAEPEGLTDPALMYEWNMGYSRVNSADNNYTRWLDQQSGLAEMAEQSRYRGSHRTGRPGAYLQRERPYGSERKYPHGNYTEHKRQRRDMEEQLRRATEQGIEDGREMIRLQRKARREEEQARARRMEEERRRIYGQQLKAAENQRRAYDAQMKVYRRQQEQGPRSSDPRGDAPPAPQYGPMGYYTPKQNAGK